MSEARKVRKDVTVSVPSLGIQGKAKEIIKNEKTSFKAKVKTVNGKKIIVFEPISEEITHPDGRKDVIIHAPSLSLINKFMEENKDKIEKLLEEHNEKK